MDVASLPMVDIANYFRASLAEGVDSFTLLATDPRLGEGRATGALVNRDGEELIHRPWSIWVDLASRLHVRIGMPEPAPNGRVRLRFERLVAAPQTAAERREKYGADSLFSMVVKPEDPSFVLDITDMLERATLPIRPRLLFLGVNRGDEVGLVMRVLGRPVDVVGIDHSVSALAQARVRYPEATFLESDLGALHELDLGEFDLVVAIDVLHSPHVDDAAVLKHIVKHLLRDQGAVCLGVPNCSYLDGQRLPGARTRNFTQPELSLLFKRVVFYRRYLSRQGFRVFVTGQHELLVTGVR